MVKAADIAGDYETVWAEIRAKYGKGAMPRTVNYVTGPSRSADIEQTICSARMGRDGLHVVIVDG